MEDGIIEKEINLAIARLVRDKLKELGYQVVMSRSVDRYVAKRGTASGKPMKFRRIFMSAFIKNSSDERSVNGMEVWYDGTDAQRDSRRLALLVSQQTAGSTGAAERMVRGDADFSCDRQHADASVPDRDRFLDKPGGAHKSSPRRSIRRRLRQDCAGHRVLFSSQNDVLDL